MYSYTFTVFTATYNRKNLLPRVYNSLKKQSYKDFEWLIVDDGSTDGTKELVEKWIRKDDININYIKKNNGGKHTAFNTAVKNADGKFFLTLDSDDFLVKEALKILINEWESINNKAEFSSVAGLCSNHDGEIVGSKFPKDKLDSNPIEIVEKYNVKGDKVAFTRTDILKEYPFPVFPGERFLTEAIIIEPIAKKYKTRFVNKLLCKIDYQKDGLSSNSILLRVSNPKGTKFYYNQSINNYNRFIYKIKQCINYVRFSFHDNCRIFSIFKIANNKLLTVISLLPGFFFYLKDLFLIKFGIGEK